MRATQHVGAAAPGPVTPESDEARRQPGFLGVQGTADSPDCRCTGTAAQAALTIEGEEYARAYLDRLQRGTVSPDELAALMAFLRGEMLAGACRVIEKALGARHA